MSSKKIYWMMLGLVATLALVALGILYIGNNSLKSSADTLNKLKLKEQVLQHQQASLTQAQRDIEQYEDFEQVAKSIVPQDKDQAKAVREIVQIANESGIKIQSVSFPSSNLGDNKRTEIAPNQNPDAPGATPPPSSGSNPALTQAEPVSGVPGVYSLEMNIVPESGGNGLVSYDRFLSFLKRLENNRRTAQVTQIRIDPITEGGTFIDFSLTINIFVKP